MSKQILIISFSSRKDGNCDSICKYIEEIDPKYTESFLFSENSITACGRCAYECFIDNKMCPYFDDPEDGLLRQLCLSDQVYFIVPNYCDYPCSNFFIFNERSQVFFQGNPERLDQYEAIPKKFIVVSGSESENFRAAFRYHVNDEPEILFLSAKRFGKKSLAGDIITSIEVRAAINEFVTPKDQELD